MEDKLKIGMFCAAFLLILVMIGYFFLCAFIKPVVDLTTPLLGLAMLLVGYYWGTSKSSADKDKVIQQGGPDDKIDSTP